GQLTLQQIRQLAAAGNEIGGHTVSHPNLVTIGAAAAQQQICTDRTTLIGFGFSVSTLAYPFGAFNAPVETAAPNCGYRVARTVGGLRDPTSCPQCALRETLPPRDPLAVRTPPSIKVNTSLQTMQQYVINAENAGGGWVPIVMHHVCNGCDTFSI